MGNRTAKHWAIIFVVALLGAIALVAAAGSIALRGGISARPEPSAAEVALARHLRHLLVPSSTRELQNPITPTGQAVIQARAHFADHCASCHGNDGKGQTGIGRGLYPRSPDLTAAATQELSDGELFYIIENGIKFTGMPGWGAAGRPEESWKLVHFIRHLPQLTERELSEMEQLNPRSPEEWKELQEEQEFLGGEGDSTANSPAHHH